MRAEPNARETRSDRGGPPDAAPIGWRWHLAALALLSLAALWNGWDWLAQGRMPPGDFPGYAAAVQSVRDALQGHGRVPIWCVECYGGTTNFTGNLKEYLVFPLALGLDPVLAAKLAFLILKVSAGFGLYLLVTRVFFSPAAGLVAGYALAFGAIANHQLEHLDAVLATALLPPTAWVAHELLRRGGAALGVALGALAACQLINNWVFALSVPLLVLAMAAVAPWGERVDRARAVRRVGAALAVFTVLAGSQLAWIAADAPHHRLVPEASTAVQRGVYVERSPFLFVNRDNALKDWLATHQPPGFDLPAWDGGRRYVGLVVLLVCGVGLFLARRDALLARWAALAGALLGVQYWLALGPRTLLWEVGESLHWSAELQGALRIGLLLASGVGLLAVRVFGVRALVASALLLLPTTSLWNGLAWLLPVFQVQRSPGHFFDIAPVWLYLVFAIALTALLRRFASPRAAQGAVFAVALLVVLDFAPSRKLFAAGTALEPLRRAGALAATLAGDASLRIGLPIAYDPLSSWVVAQAAAGHAWGWLPWQSGRHWAGLYAGALYGTRGPRPDGRGPLDPDAVLLRAARIRTLVVGPRATLPAPWRRAGESGRFSFWEQPEVSPLAQGHRSYAWLADASRRDAPVIASRALRANTLLLSQPEPSGDPAARALRGGAVAVISPGLGAPTRFAMAPEPVAVRALRPRPEHLELAVDAGEAPLLVSVAEGHHPWWRATVDGGPAPVLRANLAMMAVPVGPGAHRVELRFTPPAWLRLVDGVSMLGWIATAGGGLVLATRRVRRSRSPRAG